MTSPMVGTEQPVPTTASASDPVLDRIRKDPKRADPQQFARDSTITGRVVGQPDGDGANIQLPNGKQVAARLAYIDTPETEKIAQNKPGQPFGKEASRYLESLMKGKEVTAKVVEPASKKNYWRPVVELYADGKNLNIAMLEAGFAWPQKRYLPLEYNQAAVKGYGAGNIFSVFDPETPGAFRARLPSNNPDE